MIDPRKAGLYRTLMTGALIGCCGMSALMSACFLAGTPAPDTKVRPEEWRESRGPVVPHDSFPSDCTLCHAKGSWHEIRKDFAYDHEKETGTPLHGAHAHAQCLRCHNDRGSVAAFSKRGCGGCHEDLHRGRLGTQCTTCHSENNWNPTGIYAAHARTRFPLTGIHIGVACFRCHPAAESGQFLGADPRCEACHRSEALQAKALDHTAMGLLTNCQQCHSGASWGNARFNHAGIVGGCVNCHLKDYPANHGGMGFGTNCESCHKTVSWSGASFHPFKLSGNHNVACVRCHTAAPTSYQTYNCLNCHPHNDKTETDNHHRGRRGYVYLSSACYGCHPNLRSN